MAAKQPKPSRKSYTVHTEEFKAESLKLAEQIGISKAAKELNLHDSQLYEWRKKSVLKPVVVNEKSSNHLKSCALNVS